MTRTGRLLCGILMLSVWIAVVSTGFLWAWRYESAAGTQRSTPAQWPGDHGQVTLQKSGTCLMFAHPRCPCTRASLRQLSEILTTLPTWQTVQIILYRPDSAASEWGESDIAQSANAISRARVIWDDHGHLAQQFGVETSGHVLLYDAHGQLQFSGGITAFRGHSGHNAGAESLTALGRGQSVITRQTPVYGCSLVTPSSAATAPPCERAP